LIDGNGTPISIGRVAAITDPATDGFDADLQYAFVNQGNLQANGVFDNISATTFSVSDATLEGGINNTGTMSSTTFAGPVSALGDNGKARVIVLGANSIAEAINNSGVILATASEADDLVFADPDNPTEATNVLATAIDIEASAELSEITNNGTISVHLSKTAP